MLNYDWLLSSGFCFKKRAWPTSQTHNHDQIDSSSLNCIHFYELDVFWGGVKFYILCGPANFFIQWD